MIFRKWSAHIRTAQADGYKQHVEETDGTHYAGTAGNLGYQTLLSDLGDSTSEAMSSGGAHLSVLCLARSENRFQGKCHECDGPFIPARPLWCNGLIHGQRHTCRFTRNCEGLHRLKIHFHEVAA